jgi:peroxiredoxin Q/BCP
MRTLATSRLIQIIVTLASFVATAQLSWASEPLVAGKIAPEFELPDQFGQLHSLEDYRGQWVVLYFYPKDETPGCTTEACEFRDDIFEYKKLHSQVIGISLDDIKSHAGFAEHHGLPFPLLADPTGIVVDAYGVKTRMFGMAVAKRQTFVIDPDGYIARHYENVDPSTHSTEVLADLAELGAGSAD